VILDGEGVAVPVRTICLALGLDVQSQSDRLRNHDVLARGLRIVKVPVDGQLRSVVAILHDYIPFWLGTITPSLVRDEIREKLVHYQLELKELLNAVYGSDVTLAASGEAAASIQGVQRQVRAALHELRLLRAQLTETQQALVVEPHHQHPEGRQYRDSKEEIHGQKESQREASGGPAHPEEHKEVQRSPQQPHDQPTRKDTVTLPQCRRGEPRPAELLQEAATDKPVPETEQQQGHFVAGSEYAGEERRGGERERKGYRQKQEPGGQERYGVPACAHPPPRHSREEVTKPSPSIEEAGQQDACEAGAGEPRQHHEQGLHAG
jgi:hypothetical protein